MELETFKSSFGYWNFRTNNGKPTEEMVAYLKKNGYRWSKNNGCWYPATSEAKEKNLHGDFAAEIQRKFDEEKKTLEHNRRELPSDIIEQLVDSATNNELGKERVAAIANSIRSEAAAERTVLLEELVKKLREQIRLDQEKIQRYESALGMDGEEQAAMAEQEQIDAEAEWEKENTLTEEEERAVVEKNIEPQIERKAQTEDALALSPEELAAARSVMPDAQYRTTLNLAQGEEREFFIERLKSLAAAVNNAPKIGDGAETKEHPIVFRYFHPTGTETLVTEIGTDGEAYGFQCLNGDYEMAEWGYLDLNEIKGVRMMEIDYHVPEGMTVEKWLYKNHPEEFPQYAEIADSQEKTPFDIAQETGNDVEAIARSLQNGGTVEKEVFTPRPVALENILARMDFQLEVSESGKLMVYDTQRDEYLDNENDVDVDNEMREFNSAEEVFDRMDSFIRDYYFADMQEELDKIGVNTSNAASLADMCELYRAQIEKGQTRLSETTLNWALGIVHPDTVIMPKGFVPEKSESVEPVPDLKTYTEKSSELENKKDVQLTKLNFVLDKLSKAGIEVVTDKAEFDRIIEGQAVLQKMTEDLSDLESISKAIQEQDENILQQENTAKQLKKEEKAVNNFNFEKFVEEIQKYEKFFPKGEKIKIADFEHYEQEDGLYNDYELLIGKNKDNDLWLNFTYYNTASNSRGIHSLYNFSKKEFNLKYQNLSRYGVEWCERVFESAKKIFSEKDFIPQIHSELKTILESKQSRQADILDNLIKENASKKDSIEDKVLQIKKQQKEEARKTIQEWATKENYDIAFLNSFTRITELFGNETKSIGVLPEEVNQIFPSLDDYNLYAQKDYFIDHWVNHHSELTESIFDELQNVLDNYDDVYKDPENNTIVFVKQEGRLNDFVVVEQKNNKLVFYDSTFFRKGIPSRFEKITPAKKQELHAVEVRHTSSTAGQQVSDPAAGISTLNGTNTSITQNENLSTPKIQKMTSSEYYNKEVDAFVTDKSGFVDPEKIAAIDLYGFEKAKEMWKDGEPEWSVRMALRDKAISDYLNQKRPNIYNFQVHDTVYGFAHEGKIYLNPDIMNSEVAVHEYTHLWDAYTQRTNPELWQKGKDIFKNTKFWNDVKTDPNYTDIADNDDLLLSEVHAQICGKMADAILTKIAERDGELTKDAVIDWDNEVWDYLGSELGFMSFPITQSSDITHDQIRDFLAMPIKDLMNAKNISVLQEQLASKKDIKKIREQCREILKKPDAEITEADKAILAQYEGAGGLNEANRSNAGILNEFYTPNNLVEKVWQIVDHYAPNAKTVLEPSAGVGKFANNRPNNEFTMHELDETSARINKILHPDANIVQGAYQKQFFDESERFHVESGYKQPKYDIVIGNPPYGEYNDKWKGLGEGKEFDRYEEYFISKGLDALKDENSIVAFVVPSGFLNSANDKAKQLIAEKGELIDAYRLPEGTFPTTQVGTDIIIMRNWEKRREEINLNNHLVTIKAHAQFNIQQLKKKQEKCQKILSESEWFNQHPEKVLGKVKTRTNRFGREEEYVTAHEGLTVQDELNKIDGFFAKQNSINLEEFSLKQKEAFKGNLDWLVKARGCEKEATEEILYELYKKFPEKGEAYERSKVLPIAFGDEQLEALSQQNEINKKELETVIGIFDENLDYNTVWDRGWAIRHGMPKDEVSRLIKWDYSNAAKHEFNDALQAENKVPAKPQRPQKWGVSKKQGELMTSEEFARLYGRDFDARVFPIWKATDWQGNIDLEKLSAADIRYMSESGEYVQKAAGVWTHKELFCSGDIYAKIEEQKSLKEAFIQRYGENAVKDMDFDKNIALLESVKKPPLAMENIHFGLKTPLAESFKTTHIDEDGNAVELNLQESFILWAQNSTLAMGMWRKDIDFASANISREELGETVSFMDIVEYIDGEPVKANALRGWRASKMTEDEKKAEKAERKKEADLKRQTRSDVANRLFDRYLHEGITGETKARLEAEYNRRFNSYIAPDYSKLPLFVDGMSAWKGSSKFKLYDQQIKGISFLCNKGNGLLAYDVGVGKTAAGITATENQMQLGRSKRPFIIVPNQVYSKWYTDIKQLFPKTKINDLYNLGRDSIAKFVDPNNPHKLNLPENSISLCTYEALKNITFKDESCVGPLFEDFKDLLSADFDGSESENAAAKEKIAGVIGVSSQVKNPNYVFFEDCGFDHITVDEAHNFKNLWVVPRPKKKGQSNEYAGIPSGKPSNRALKMFAMTQLVQRNNNDRNVFMLTATPFTNSPTEVYSMLSYIGRERLKQSGIDSLRSFFEEFAQTKQELGVTSSGEIDTKQVMKNWKELPALQSILTEFIDKVDGEEAGIIRPNKYTHVKPLDMSELQKEMREIDEARMAGALGVESTSADTIVAMNNMRLSCVAPALANPAMYPGVNLPSMKELVETSPKLKFVCDAIIDMYKENPEKGQFMYVPLGKDSHGIIKDYLVRHGIPKEAVEIINGEINNSVEKKEKITASFNDEKSKLKILIGGRNTAEGIDLNGNSFVMYNCSLGWNPSETVQAEGRIWRQGNLQGNVHIVYPVMNDSIDSVLYQKHDEKISRIGELWSYKGDALNVEDINPEDLKLDLIKDPRKKANLILKEETKGIKAELSSVELKIKDFDDIVERRQQMSLDFNGARDALEYHEGIAKKEKEIGNEIPDWLKQEIKRDRQAVARYESGKSRMDERLTALNLVTDDDITEYVLGLNNQKHKLEKQIKDVEKKLPEILAKLETERLEQKLMEYPVEKQREILEADILNNLRPMKEVEWEVRTARHEAMLDEMLKAGDITQEERDLYKAAGWEKYQKWLDGEIDSLDGTAQSVKAAEEKNKPAIEPVKQESVEIKTVSGLPTKDQLAELKKPEMASAAKELASDEDGLFFGCDTEDMFVKSPKAEYGVQETIDTVHARLMSNKEKLEKIGFKYNEEKRSFEKEFNLYNQEAGKFDKALYEIYVAGEWMGTWENGEYKHVRNNTPILWTKTTNLSNGTYFDDGNPNVKEGLFDASLGDAVLSGYRRGVVELGEATKFWMEQAEYHNYNHAAVIFGKRMANSMAKTLRNDEAAYSEFMYPYSVSDSMRFNYGKSDPWLTPDQLKKSEMRRDEIVLPILNGKESGMYKAFNDFAKRGVFDIVGQKLDLQSEGKISDEGFAQLRAAMDIYRDKRFETMRYVLIDKSTGEIRDHLAVSSKMPNVTLAVTGVDMLKDLVTRAEEKNCMICAVHNHPSGRTDPSVEDMETTVALNKMFTNQQTGKSLFAGHIILDHGTYSLYTSKNGWKNVVDLERLGKKDSMLNEKFPLSNQEILNGETLSNVATKVNDINNWNDDFVPVIFTDGGEIKGLKFYDVSFFKKDAFEIRTELQFAGLEVGAVRAFPVYTEALSQKLGAMSMVFEDRLEELVRLNAFTDAALPLGCGCFNSVTEKAGVKPGADFFSAHTAKNNPSVESTWESRINPSLFSKNIVELPGQREPEKTKKYSGMGY